MSITNFDIDLEAAWRNTNIYTAVKGISPIDPNHHHNDKVYCCFKWKSFIQDIEEKGDTILITKEGKISFVNTRPCDTMESKDETRYPFYDFYKCPYCGNVLIQ